jgi:alanyl-tRNA synthetase
MTSNELRKKFLDFFASKGHRIFPSTLLLPKEDPTVLFTAAGMNQFKDYFLGRKTDLKRAASCQRCLRTDDLEKVGKTPYHHTFFEMLGNFSFGDYFKKEAILFAWEFLTGILGVKEKDLWVSVYRQDDEAFNIWRKTVGLSEKKIARLGPKENFWPSNAPQNGPNGPCGPCSEIFYDQGTSFGCGRPECGPGCNCGRFAEVWNLVFTQFDRTTEGNLEPLPRKNIDTGMGLERMAGVLQGVHTNFEIDIFKPIIKSIKHYAGTSGRHTVTSQSVYIIADHIRAIGFAIADGAMPSNEDRGYVVRKLIRRSLVSARALGIDSPFLYKLVPVVAQLMQEPYPQLYRRKEEIAGIILSEEEQFFSIIELSQSMFEEKFRPFLNKGAQTAGSGHIAFQLYDTRGIPLEITQAWARERGFQIKMDEFNDDLARQRELSRSASRMKGEIFAKKGLLTNLPPSEFIGYRKVLTQAQVLKILEDSKEIPAATQGQKVKIILDKTVFYPESGGQVADTGRIFKGDDIEIAVFDTQKIDSAILHFGQIQRGRLKIGDIVTAQIDLLRRIDIARNHTATHLLQAALRQILGDHVEQSGSLVGPERLRFDFKHPGPLSKRELRRIEQVINERIQNDDSVTTVEQNYQEALALGALAFFAEKYDQIVRVVSIGDYSRELCGGTHLNSTGSVGTFKILRESSVASGIRRIEAITGRAVYEKMSQQEELIDELCELLKSQPDNLVKTVKALKSDLKIRERSFRDLRLKLFRVGLADIINHAEKIGDVHLVVEKIEDADMELLRSMVDVLKHELKSVVVVLGSVHQNKANLVMGITKELAASGLNAANIIKDVARGLKGSGGGRAELAQAGGEYVSGLDDALSFSVDVIKERLKGSKGSY